MGFWISPDVLSEQSCFCSIFKCEPIGYAGADRVPIGVRKSTEAYAHRSARRPTGTQFLGEFGAHMRPGVALKNFAYGVSDRKNGLSRWCAGRRKCISMHAFMHTYTAGRKERGSHPPRFLVCLGGDSPTRGVRLGFVHHAGTQDF